MQDLSFADHYGSAPLADYVRESRVGSSLPVQLFEIVQPAGDYGDPALDDLLLCMALSRHHCRHLNGGERWQGRATPGDLCVVAPGTPTEVLLDDRNAFRVVSIPSARARDLLTELRPSGEPFDFGRLHRGDVKVRNAEALIERLWSISDAAGNQLHCDSLLVVLLGELLDTAERATTRQLRGGLAPWQVARVTDYIDAHLDEDVQLNELSALIGLSPSHVCRTFKQSTGLPPHAWQLQRRIERACELLTSSDQSITDIALAVGYSGPNQLARLFGKTFDMSPGEYRRRRRF